MNKTLLTIATLALLALFTSAYYSAPADSRIDCNAPTLQLGNNDISPLTMHHGETVLLTFWSSTDPQSRLNNKRHDSLARNARGAFSHVSVNMDRSSSVFNGVLTIDHLNRATHYRASQQTQPDIITTWRLQDSYHSFLIDGEGKIIAIDPDDATLASLH